MGKTVLLDVVMLVRMLSVSSMLMVSMIGAGFAHEVRPSVADLSLSNGQMQLNIRLTAETLLAGIDMSQVANTNDAPQAADYDRLRALPEAELEQQLRQAWPEIAAGLRLRAGDTALVPVLDSVTVVPEPDAELPRDTEITVSAVLPDGDDPVTLGWDTTYGALVVRQMEGGDSAYTGYLDAGQTSEQIPRIGGLNESAGKVFLRYIPIGFAHIIPLGLDHILFVLGLFFFSLALRPLLLQVTAFTLAHTVTLALASLGVVSVPASVVEPLIAASIVYVAVENILRPKLGWWRTAVVFGFGLLHGLGFASVLGEVGLDPSRFVVGLIGFNVGVELGQLAVIALAFLTVGLWFGKKDWYRPLIATPVSVAIAIMGAWWVVERTLL